MIRLIKFNLISLFKELILAVSISFLIYLIFILFPIEINPWPYGNAGDANENIRTSFFTTWGYLPIKDIAINHMPGVPELLYFGSKFGLFLTHKNIQDLHILNIQGSYSSSICLQVALAYSTLRFFFRKLISFFLTLILVLFTTYKIYYFLPLSESFIPYLLMLWGGIYLNRNEKEPYHKYYFFRTINLITILIIIIWVGLTSPFSIMLLGLINITEINYKSRAKSIINNLKAALIPILISILFFQLRYGLLDLYKWNILVNSSINDLSKIIINFKNQFLYNYHGHILDNQNISLYIIFLSLIIYTYGKVIFDRKKKRRIYLERNHLDNLKRIFLIKIPLFSGVIYICQILDSWRVIGGGFGYSTIFKTEASWGLLIPLISFLIISCKKLIKDLHILNLVDNNFHPKINKPFINPLIFTLTTYALSILIINITIFYPKFILASEYISKPTLEGIPELMPKKDYINGDQKCGVIDSWYPKAWLLYNAQPCLGVFVNSAPGITDNKILENDISNLIESGKMTIRTFQEINEGDPWPIYGRKFAEQIECKKASRDFELVCEKKLD